MLDADDGFGRAESDASQDGDKREKQFHVSSLFLLKQNQTENNSAAPTVSDFSQLSTLSDCLVISNFQTFRHLTRCEEIFSDPSLRNERRLPDFDLGHLKRLNFFLGLFFGPANSFSEDRIPSGFSFFGPHGSGDRFHSCFDLFLTGGQRLRDSRRGKEERETLCSLLS